DAAATDEQRIHAHLLAGIANRVAGKDLDARTNFRYVLLKHPDWQLAEDTPPKVALFFEGIRQEIAAERDQAKPDTASPFVANGPVWPQSPRPAEQPSSLDAGVVAAGTLTAAGVIAVVVGACGLVFAETSLADPSRPGDERTSLRALGQWSTGGAVL